MNHIDENLDVTTYFKESLRTVDGLAWLAVSIASVFCLMDIFFEINLIPLRDAAKPGKAIALLVVTPLLVFLFLVRLRQLPFGSYTFSSLLRACVCIYAFLAINF